MIQISFMQPAEHAGSYLSRPAWFDSGYSARSVVLKMRPSRFRLSLFGEAPESGLAPLRLPQVADAAPSACATSERRSETWQWNSTPQLPAPPAQFLWAAGGAVSLTPACRLMKRSKMKLGGLLKCWT